MIPLIKDGLRRIKDGLTTIEEVLAVATIEQEATEEKTIKAVESKEK